MNTHTLTRHRDIQSWAMEHHGTPAIHRSHNRFGGMESRLVLAFATPKAPPARGMPQIDDGLSPVSWTAWLAELDRQQLVLRVFESADYELVRRRDLN
jgi:hypothetical protein